MSLEKSFKHRLMLAGIGLIAGVFQYIFSEILKGEPNANTALVLSWAFVVIWAAFLVFTWNDEHRGRLLISSAVITLLYVLALWWVISLLPEKTEKFRGDDDRFATWGSFTFFAWFLLLPFLGIFKDTGRFRFDYTNLFRYSWNNVFIIMIGGLVASLIWVLLSIWAGLFSVVKIKFFADVFYSKPFIAISTPTMFAFGVAMGRENDNIINTLLRITLTIFKALFPVLIFVVLIFFAVLPFTGLGPLLETNHASKILFALVSLGLIFINSVFQDGKGEKPYPVWMLRAVDAMLILLPFLCAIALYALGVRVSQYGLSQERFIGLVGLSIGLAYSMGYAAAAIQGLVKRSDEWLALMRPVNTAMALVIAAILLLMHTPVLDPIGHSARNQYNRLMAGKVKPVEFDYRHMLRDLGRRGDEYVRRIEKSTDKKFAALKGDIAKFRKTGISNRFALEPDGKTELAQKDLRIYTPDGKLPDGLFDEIKKTFTGRMVRDCRSDAHCAIFALNVDGDDAPEYFLTTSNNVGSMQCFDLNKDGEWRMVKRYDFSYASGKKTFKAERLKEILSDGKARAVPSLYSDVEIDGRRYLPR